MSIIETSIISCHRCGHSFSATHYGSVNTDLGKDIPQKIISGELFRATCPSCGAQTLLAYNILYHDMKNKSMVWVIIPNDDEYSKQVDEVRHTQKNIPYNNTRIVSSMRALSEKVSCLEANRDDRVIEICKYILKLQLMDQQPDSKITASYYTYANGEENISFFDASGNNYSCELSDEVYNNTLSLINDYSAELPSEPFQIIDSKWAEPYLMNMMSTKLPDESEEDTCSDYPQSTVVTEEPSTSSAPVRNVYCRKCGHKLYEDSIFCDKCGTKIKTPSDVPDKLAVNQPPVNVAVQAANNIPTKNITANPSPVPQKQQKNSNKENYIAIILLVILVAMAFLFGDPEVNKAQHNISAPIQTQQPLSLPETGKVFFGKALERESSLTVYNKTSSSCLIKLKDSSNKDIFSFFVRAHDTIDMAVPTGNYYIYIAQGDEWYGAVDCFGEETCYYKNDELIDFYNYTWEYTLFTTTNDNFSETPISANEF